jgi:ligand-binding sensor domain-containing protein
MKTTTCKIISTVKNLFFVFFLLQILSCTKSVKEKPVQNDVKEDVINTPLILNQNTTFPQIHTNLNGMVREFVRTMHQDKKGNYWFGTNGDGIIRYNGQTLEKIRIEGISPRIRVLEIVEDQDGNVWFGTSDGLIKYDGEKFLTFSNEEGLQGDVEIWDLTIDKNGLMWVGSMEGVSHFDGEKFKALSLPENMVENPDPIFSIKRVSGLLEDNDGNMWISRDGNGIFKYNNGNFTQLTTKNGLTDNNASAALLDKQGNIWIRSFYGGASKFDGTTFTNFTKDGIIEGVETASFIEDSKGNIWFTAENVGVYKYDGTEFTLYTTEHGLTSNVVLSIFEDHKGQLWFGTWQGLCIFDGEKFVDAKEIEPWTSFR